MDMNLTPEEAKFRDEMRAFFRTRIPEELRRKGYEGRQFSKEDYVNTMRILNAHGLAVPHWPVEWGGRDWTPFQKNIYKDEYYLSGTPEPSGFNLGMLGPVLIQFGTEEQKKFFLPKLRNFDVWFCQGFSEPGAGSDLASLKTTARRDGDHYVVNGHKIWTSQGHHADWCFLLARTSQSAKKQDGISFILVQMNTPGITVRPIITLDGRHEVNEVFWDNVRVPVANLVHVEGRGWDVAKFLLGNERSGIARVGVSKLRIQRARELAKTIETARGTLADDPRLKDRMTELEVELKALEIATMRAVAAETKRHDSGKPDPISSVLKLKGSELTQATTELLVQVAGPWSTPWQPDRQDKRPNEPVVGPAWANSLAPNYYYMRAATIYGGSNEIQRNILSKAVLGL
jgi:alkylation response protein AidB-like acyl-CoA dehydrogenase